MTNERMPQDAEGWFARLRAGKPSAEERAAFEAWLAKDEACRQAFERLERLWGNFETVRADPTVLAMRAQARSRKHVWVPRALVAAVVLCALGLAIFKFEQGVRWRSSAAQAQALSYETRVGQKSTITLPDGTLVVLDTDSAFLSRATATERRIELTRGRAFFDVVKDPARPFSVAAGGKTVTAVGTSFDVDLRPEAVAVTLVTGRLRVRGPGATHAPSGAGVVEMHEGQRLIASNSEPWTLRPTDSAADTGWLRGQLVFDEETLANIAAALNRYSHRKIVIPDPKVAAKRLSAVLLAGDIDTFVQAADTLGLARVGASDARHVELVSP
jgi:transmembrane sensor